MPSSGETDKARILIIDDDRDTRDVLEFELLSYGYDVRKAASGKEGIAIAGEWRPSRILLDIGMPGMDGYEVARRLRELDLQPVKLIALTGFGTAEDRQRALQSGFDAHVVKGTARFVEEFEKALRHVEGSDRSHERCD
jgi:two-component system, sensor histidine kinase